MKSKRRPAPPRDRAARDAPGRTWALLLLVFGSGFAALVYEMLWFRQLGLVFGNTVQAAATVLTAFMLGLAGGAFWARRWLKRTANPLRLFGLIEAGIGVYALFVPAGFGLIGLAYQGAVRLGVDHGPSLTALRFGLALLALLVPTLLMGASLPVLSEAALRSREKFAGQMGRIYGSNTAGATLGVLACGFVFVPSWGVQTSNALAAALNLAVGAGAWFLGRSAGPLFVEVTGGPGRASRERLPVGLLAIAALCGALALAFETVWFRALVLVFGSTSYAFAIMVACFLFGIALGSAALGGLANRKAAAAWALAGSLAGIGLWAIYSVRIYPAAPERLLAMLARADFTWAGMLRSQAALAGLFLLPLAILSGLAFTAVVRLIREDAGSAGRAVGAAFSVNALGSAAGSALAGFALLPAFGLERSLLLLGVASVAIAAVFACWRCGVAWPARLVFVAAAVGGAVALRVGAAGWDPLVLSAGAYFAARANVADGKVQLRERLRSVELLYYREGATATIDVKRSSDGRLYFSSDGKVEADTSPQSMVLQRMMGHLPMLVHPRPRRVLNIGLGAGVTCGALRCYPEASVEVVDIEPAVKDVAAFWADRNHDLMRRGGFDFLVNDGRNHLLVTRNLYDVITSDPFEPVVAGAASLYTVEHFRLARSRLAPDGVMAQFLPLYELSRADLLVILRSFLTVFPRSCVFFTGTDTILLGLTGEADLRLPVAAAKFEVPAVRDSLAEIGVDGPERLLEMMVMDIDPARQPILSGPLNTDDLPAIEFSAPRSALDYHADSNQTVLLEHFQDISPSRLEAVSPERLEQVRRGHEGLKNVLRASILRSAGKLEEALGLLEEAVREAPLNPIIRNELAGSLLLVADGVASTADALPVYRRAAEVDPTNFYALHGAVVAAHAAGQSALADDYLAQAFAAYPESASLLVLRGRVAGVRGDFVAACRDLERAVAKLPRRADYWRYYAEFLARAGRDGEARAAEKRAEELERR